MIFIEQTSDLAEVLAERLIDVLTANNRVVWLVPGGSNIPITVGAMNLIPAELSARLVVMQTDERFVPLDSPDCNWKQLKDAGLDTKQATTLPILDGSSDLTQTATRYAEIVQREFEAADYVIGQFGIGSDCHIAGIKPGSSASMANKLVDGFVGDDFSRVTLTFPAIKKIDEAVLFAFGESKHHVLAELQRGAHESTDFPAGILHNVPHTTVYSDYVGDKKEQI
jgi:6-phosphogluconolactonase/glucosamine-6-phosphate isomerase/deaminase